MARAAPRVPGQRSLVSNVLITNTMVLRPRAGVAFALLFSLAMGLHFVLTDRGLEERYPDASARVAGRRRRCAAGGLAEILSDRRSSLGWFVVGLVLYAGLLAVVTAVGD